MTAAEQGTGTLIVVVGPSGAGKDSVMGFAARHFAERPDILFVRRVITRPSDAGSEVHESVSDAEFEEMRRSGIFAVFWRAHGLSYGIPAEISEKVAAGMTAIVNGSRAALPAIRQAFGKIAVVVITADLPVLARRLAERGRESEEDVLRRLTRQAPDLIAEPDVTVIDNSDRLEIAGRHFVALVERHSARSHHPA
ncbi:phosphonate metabolism protein/1,5-bisphosphokinase (PRPP-forming) PhnN (plasmid) [Sinorhizobium medicae]|uniref:phosphonate metabolism protein/1,5-bisphosphokinase (PRPP-forming) PhnN n=1 Tax=Sinorhizobium medicae TaxID=110321 RepID=UPI00036217A3|nr:phosphonate metabolism protein/1,5-bisphosphokinase (PRPP-forming) PhnN [Sinorhizobium medicae]WQO49223.1 phosphonate metabolism protein/1,5-bisphosphokinase (PRPP-forming) PhnN [Sinorhizobium medicae]WQO69292.1 phosphonate metabolism protein/1,5-bisphosphokinase (PRPP-forming) PhnN [Sinorhizobium medicae]WQO76423.1 phosphonate metabolism protein/1,5-bisphosphokinase (PRPP-forming) PhnN [Sinorhizobium medicae]WQO95595.1 phosphonate metabolism protein/1,5-bisphosphokinase (PRPP-forming) PhnN 